MRRAAHVAAWLVLGAAMNVGVVCLIAYQVEHSWSDYDTVGSGWPLPPPAGWPETPDGWSQGLGVGLSTRGASHNMDELARTRMQDPSVVVHTLFVHEYGVPLRAMRIRRLIIQAGRTITEPGVSLVQSGVEFPRSLGPFHYAFQRIPLEPVWPGFAVNTAAYAGLAWGVATGWGRTRRWIRVRRGRCPWCGYPVGVSAVCTECGKAVGKPGAGTSNPHPKAP